MLESLIGFFRGEGKISVAYLFGSYVKGRRDPFSDVDVALLLSEEPKSLKELLEYYLYLLNGLSDILGDRVDLIILNVSPPLLRYQVIKHGRVVYSRDERARVGFEARSLREYLDLSRVTGRYDECLVRQALA
ncbi:MAG: type VII toxin-antitoxin system MntA family adenylyltransferase antitoxin [Candidatus Bathyarchaeia archaeon]